MAKPATIATKRPKRSYSNEEVGNALAALKANAGNLYATAKQLGIPYPTLREWDRNKRRDSNEVRTIQHNAELGILDLYATLERRMLEHASKDEVIEEMKGLDATKAAKLSRDAQHIMQGLPTSINEERTIDSRQVLVLLQDSLSAPQAAPLDPLDTARNVTPNGTETHAPAAELEPVPAAQAEGRFTRILRERREANAAAEPNPHQL